MSRWLQFAGAACACAALASQAPAFNFADRWQTTAISGPVGPHGTPITLTWGIVPDGTVIPNVFPNVNKPSNLISSFDALLGNGGGGALADRPWVQRIKQSFDRWSEISGVTFLYTANDDGVEHGTFPGLRVNGVDVRGDIRVGGAFIDGNGGTLGYTIFPDNADLVLDTGDTTYYGSSTNNNSNLRNTTTHEIGHSLGLGHIDSNTAAFLMESLNNPFIDGPQLDDIRGMQQLYGDALEKANNGAGNNSPLTATDWGMFGPGQSKLIGTHAATGTAVLATETDFVSIANHNDLDYFSFTTAGPTSVDVLLTPMGVSYNERLGSSGPYTTTNASAVSDLRLDVYRLEGEVPTLLQSSDSHPIGQAESIAGLALASAGQYLIRVAGLSDVVQFYQLGLQVASLSTPVLVGDYNQDGRVDGADYVTWRAALGQTGSGLAADGNADEIVNELDYGIWRSHFGGGVGASVGGAAVVPEPAILPMCLAICLGFGVQFGSRRWRIT